MAKQQRRPKVQRTCKQCGTHFLVRQSAIDSGRGMFCSRECSWKAKVRPKTYRVCKQCGSAFVGKRGSVFCSNKCTTEANRRPKIERACKQCGETFFVHQHQVDTGQGVYCSRACSDQGQKRPMPVHTCQFCGKVFAAKKRKPERKYCSRDCFQKVRAETAKKLHSDGRPHEHDKWRLAVILRDKKCVRCGARENLQAHHLKTWKHHPERRCDTENGAALCPLCHHAQHPYLSLEGFVAGGGKTVKYCVVCENAFLVRRESQMVCSRKCGWERKNAARSATLQQALMGGGSQVNSQQAAAMSRKPA